MASHSGPESCGVHCEVHVEALTGETDRPDIEPRNNYSGMPTLLSEAEGNMAHGVNRKSCADLARSETLRMSGSLSYGSSEISSVSGAVGPDGTGKVNDRKPVIDADEKSDTPILPEKLPNKGDDPAEVMEGRGVTRGNADGNPRAGHRAGINARRWDSKAYGKPQGGTGSCVSRHCCITSHRRYWWRASMLCASRRRPGWTA